MNKIMKIFVVIVICFVQVSAQNTTKTGTTAAQFLKVGVGARSIAMGSAFTATANDVSAIYWNPAGLAGLTSNNQVAFNHINWIADIGHDFAAVSYNLGGFGTIGGAVTLNKSIDNMTVRTVEEPEGTGAKFDAGAMSISLSYARNLTDNFSIGFNVKYVNEYIWHESATGFALDAGVLYKIAILNEFRIGASISNFGMKMKLDGRDLIEIQKTGNGNLINEVIEVESWDLPLMFRVGVAADLIRTESSRFSMGIDAVHPNDHTEYVNVGGEYAWNNLIFMRCGYSSLFEVNTEKGLTAGVGLNYRLIHSVSLLFDYAYLDLGRLEDVHSFSIGLKF